MDQESHVLAAMPELEDNDSKSWSFTGVPTRHNAVFLHGGWRCSSTYIWSRFRGSRYAMCFYEPFHEALASCTRKTIHRDTYSSWSSRHPRLTQPYRQEYVSLLGRRGIPGYDQEFALARYFLPPEGIKPETRYLARLVDAASQAGKRAVFGFSRSLARSAALKRALGGYHIVIRRNHLQQWLSCRSYRVNEGSAYFEMCHFLVLALAPENTPAGRVARHLGLPRPPPGHFRRQYDFLYRTLWPWTEEFSYRAFLAVHMLSYAIAKTPADLTIDMDRLHANESYGQRLRGAIFASTGLVLNFRDCRLGRHETDQIRFDPVAIEADVLRALGQYGMVGHPNL
ncbi:MAG TPA: hypothetical protein VI653_05395 [Steroidobacteraceae bacterium]